MLYRFKFRVRSKGTSAEKFVFSLEEGREVFLDPTFQPSPVHTENTRYFLSAFDGKATLHFLGDGSSWNGKPAPKGPVELHPGHLVQCSNHVVEILECPENNAGRETTRFLDLTSFLESGPVAAPAPAPAPRPKATAPAAFEAGKRPSATAPLPSPMESGAKPAFQPMPASSLASPDSVARPEPGDTFDADNFHSPFANSIPVVEPPRYLDPRGGNPHTTAIAVVGAILLFAALALPHSPLVRALRRTQEPTSAAPQLLEPLTRVPASRSPSQVLPAVVPPVESNKEKHLDPKVAAFLDAVRTGDSVSVRNAIEKDFLSQDFTYDEEGRSPLLLAAANGHPEIVRYLASRKADTNSIDFTGNTALMLATANGHEETVNLLLKMGVNPAVRRQDGIDALSLARQGKNENIRSAIETAMQAGVQDAPVRAPASLP